MYNQSLLRVEVEKRLRTIAEDEGLPLQELMAAWASYEPLLRFVDPPSLRDAARRAAARDPNDAAYFELQVGVDAAAVYTEDPDLRAMGAPVVDRHTVRAARTYARAASISFTLRVSGVVVFTMGVAALQVMVDLLRGGLRATRRLPQWVQASLVVGVFVLLADPRARAWLRDRLRVMGSHAWAAVREVMPAVAAVMEQADTAAVRAQEAWSEVDGYLPQRSGLPSQPLHVHVLAACTRAARPLTTDEIAEAVRTQGYRGGNAPSRDYMLRVLRTQSSLVRTADMRWRVRAV